MAVSYSVSSDKRRGALAKLITDIQMQGISFLEDQKNLEMICKVLDLDAITIHGKDKAAPLYSVGKYPAGLPCLSEFPTNEKYWECFGADGIYVENKVAKLVGVQPEFYRSLKKHDIGAMVQCVDVPSDEYACLVSFDVLESGRKWNNPDIEMLTIIGKMICNLVIQKPRD